MQDSYTRCLPGANRTGRAPIFYEPERERAHLHLRLREPWWSHGGIRALEQKARCTWESLSLRSNPGLATANLCNLGLVTRTR